MGWRERMWTTLVLTFAAAFLLTATTEAPLPPVRITGAQDVEGKLLTHTDGFWYVFDEKGTQKGALIAIPDEKVEVVTVPPKRESANVK